MIRSDNWWREFGPRVITPYSGTLVSSGYHGKETYRAISSGQSCAGYDLTLSDKVLQYGDDVKADDLGKFYVDPKNFNPSILNQLPVKQNRNGRFVILEPYAYALGCSNEVIKMPIDHVGICIGKSTYARSGLHVNTTPLEPGWEGKLTIEFHNSSQWPLAIYVGEGFCQLLLMPCDTVPLVAYNNRNGKYMNQTDVTLPKV